MFCATGEKGATQSMAAVKSDGSHCDNGRRHALLLGFNRVEAGAERAFALMLKAW
jgi:hypothetical protein